MVMDSEAVAGTRQPHMAMRMIVVVRAIIVAALSTMKKKKEKIGTIQGWGKKTGLLYGGREKKKSSHHPPTHPNMPTPRTTG